MEYCGIDAHSKSSTVCVINKSGEELMLTKTPNTKQGLGKEVGMWDICMPIVIEACSTSRPVIRYLREIGFENVIVVNPQATSQMRARGKKTDYVDARGLAELARLGLADAWHVHIPGDWAQQMRDLLYDREFVIKHRVAITNRVMAIFRREGKMSPSLKGESGWRKISELLPEYTEFYRRMLRQYLDRETALTGRIKSEAAKHPQYEFVRLGLKSLNRRLGTIPRKTRPEQSHFRAKPSRPSPQGVARASLDCSARKCGKKVNVEGQIGLQRYKPRKEAQTHLP